MIEMVSLMWICALFAAVLGFLRGWYREIIVTGSIILATALVVRLDATLRGVLLTGINREQVFIVQILMFSAVVYFGYHRRFGVNDRQREGVGAGIIGGVMGFINGYLIGGMVWYLLDINEYPFSTILSAPALGSPSAESILSLPVVVLSGGITGGGEFLIGLTIAIFIIILVAF